MVLAVVFLGDRIALHQIAAFGVVVFSIYGLIAAGIARHRQRAA